jgi:hypothetical protein
MHIRAPAFAKRYGVARRMTRWIGFSDRRFAVAKDDAKRSAVCCVIHERLTALHSYQRVRDNAFHLPLAFSCTDPTNRGNGGNGGKDV